jgi:hypothetical protein
VGDREDRRPVRPVPDAVARVGPVVVAARAIRITLEEHGRRDEGGGMKDETDHGEAGRCVGNR